MVDPATVVTMLAGYFGAHYLDNVVAGEINNAGHYVVRRTIRAFTGDAEERVNHDIARTVRLAQIAALEEVLEGYGRLHANALAYGDNHRTAFLSAAASFCRQQRRLARTEPAALEPLQAAVDGLLAAPPDGSPARAYADVVGTFAEDAVLDEMRQRLEVAVPDDFEAYLRRGAAGDHPRFLDEFADDIRKAVKSNARYRDILLASGISEIKLQGFEITEIVLHLEQQFGLDRASSRAAVDRIGQGIAQIDATTQATAVDVAEIKALVRHLVEINATSAGPGLAPNVAGAVSDIAAGAREGDTRLSQALDLLKSERVEEAVPLLRAFAEDRRARIVQDSKEAATAYRNLGVIAGLRDPKAAFDAYTMAADLDPTDVESLLWCGWLALERGDLGVAETRLGRVLALAGEEGRWRTWARIGLGDAHQARGDLAAALTRYRDSLAIAECLAKADPGNAGWQRDLSVSHNKIGEVQQAQGDLAAALASYQDALAIAECLAKADPGNAEWQRDLSVSHDKIGDVQQAQGDLAAALVSYQADLAIAERLAKADPGNAGWQRDLSVSQDRIGDVQQTQGDLAAALASYQDSLTIGERLAKADPGNAGWQRDLSVSHNRIGDVQQARGDLAAALASYQASHEIFERLAKAVPGNAGWQRDLSVSHDRIGDVQQAQGDLAAALPSYQESLAIRERLAEADLGNAGWQHDLSISQEKVGDVQQAQGDLAAALASYHASLTIRERLAKADPGNAGWQRDLSVSQEKIGDVQRAQGDLAAALASYQDSLAIRERLAKADPGNAEWQHDLSVSLERVGDIRRQRGETAEAISAFERALQIYRDLEVRQPSDVRPRLFSVVPLWHLGGLKGQAGRGELEVALAILRPLAAADRLDAMRRGWIGQIEEELAGIGVGGNGERSLGCDGGLKPTLRSDGLSGRKRGWIGGLKKSRGDGEWG